MTSNLLRRRTAAALLGAACAATTLTGTASPSSAAAAKSTTYPATWVFGAGDVTGELRRYPHMDDYLSAAYHDRVTAVPGAGEAVKVGGQACLDGTYYQSGLSLFAEPKDWANLAAGVANRGARVRIACTGSDGVIHHFHWGSYVTDPKPDATTTEGAAATTSIDCVLLTKTTSESSSTFTLTAADGCVAQDRIVNNKGNVLDVTNGFVPFSATITVPGLK